MITLQRDITRCLGDFSDHWLGKSEPCARRNECARYVAMTWDQIRSETSVSTMSHCVDEGRLSAFMPVTEAMSDEE